ncbi:hypothetical protein FIA58_009975 [Flavobacterium jejuense]|uniref:Lipoprotein n=1 Tax=Flavobacterium jejuense TaxID=1544455 RepID=A0ABX0IQZ8_9FLAO|nr:hypothetical protein [Flavobacterium jejuense]NHN26001.1 hypothetical protein [Flavobacterium jejuense]
MKRLLSLLLLFVGFILSCNSNNSKKSDTSTSRLLPEPDVLERLNYQKTSIDTLFKYSEDKLLVLAKLIDKNEIVQIKNGNFPENVEVTFNILKDSLGQIISASEFPFSESGDWNITLTHYFDKDGKTFAFERQTNFFNSICTDGVAYETKTEFYNSDFQLIDKMYKLVDQNNNSLQKDSCQFPYDYEYKILADIDNYLNTNSIKNSK